MTSMNLINNWLKIFLKTLLRYIAHNFCLLCLVLYNLGKNNNLENSISDLLFDKKAGNILLLCHYHFFLSCGRNRKWIRFEFPLFRFCFVEIRWKFLLIARKFGKILGAQQGNLLKGTDKCSGCSLICGTRRPWTTFLIWLHLFLCLLWFAWIQCLTIVIVFELIYL